LVAYSFNKEVARYSGAIRDIPHFVDFIKEHRPGRNQANVQDAIRAGNAAGAAGTAATVLTEAGGEDDDDDADDVDVASAAFAVVKLTDVNFVDGVANGWTFVKFFTP
jgi:hypothetical protein